MASPTHLQKIGVEEAEDSSRGLEDLGTPSGSLAKLHATPETNS